MRAVPIGADGWAELEAPEGVREAVAGAALRPELMDEVLPVIGTGLLGRLFELLGTVTVLVGGSKVLELFCLERFLVRLLKAPLDVPLGGPAGDALGGPADGALRAPVLPLRARMAL